MREEGRGRIVGNLEYAIVMVQSLPKGLMRVGERKSDPLSISNISLSIFFRHVPMF